MWFRHCWEGMTSLRLPQSKGLITTDISDNVTLRLAPEDLTRVVMICYGRFCICEIAAVATITDPWDLRITGQFARFSVVKVHLPGTHTNFYTQLQISHPWHYAVCIQNYFHFFCISREKVSHAGLKNKWGWISDDRVLRYVLLSKITEIEQIQIVITWNRY